MAVWSIAIVLLCFAVLLAIVPIIKECLYRDYNRYNDFISDLEQIKLFYSNNNINQMTLECKES